MITYIATNTVNGRFYIGSTVNFERRKREHLSSKSNYPFHRALRKKPEVFEWEYWEDDSDEPIFEQALLDIWCGKDQCYNLNKYADRPMPVPIEVIRETNAKNLRLGIGIFNPEYTNSNKYIEDRSRGGKNKIKQITEGIGIHHPDYHNTEERKNLERETGKRLAEEKLGMFSPEVRERHAREHGEKMKGRRWITNGREEKMIPASDPLPDGWRYNRKP